jgi:threonine 3-dehydrogenase
MCFQCRTGHAHMCERTKILGVDRDGAFAEYVAVPESVVWLNDRGRLTPEIASLQEPFGNAVFATGEQELTGRSVAVLGCGPIGLFSIAIASASGAAGVWASDRTAFRLGLATQMGANAAVDVDAVDDVPGWFKRQNEGHGLDVVFEMSGAARSITDAFQIARNGGRVILFGIPSRPVEIDVAEAMIFKNLSVLALNGRRIFDTWYKTSWMLKSGVVDLSPLITARLDGLQGHEAAFEQLAAGEACKIVVFPNGEQAARDAAGSSREALVGPGRGRGREPSWAHR